MYEPPCILKLVAVGVSASPMCINHFNNVHLCVMCVIKALHYNLFIFCPLQAEKFWNFNDLILLHQVICASYNC